jgi:hypothetical protein
MKFRSLVAGAALAALAAAAVAGPAGAVVISNGAYSVGINEYGQLYDASGVGFRRESDGVDVMATYSQRDSWGVNGHYADEGFYSNNGVTAGAFSSTADSAVANVTTDGGFSVTQSFSFVAPNILAIETDLTNISGGDLSAQFQRLAEFHVDLGGAAPLIEYETNPYSTGLQTTYVGFDDPSTAGAWDFPCCSADPYDGGAGFRLNLGAIAAGATRSFTFYYGLGDTGLAGQFAASGATDVMLVANADGSLAGGMGVAIAPIPEPTTWAMMILGFFGLGSMLRRRKAALA